MRKRNQCIFCQGAGMSKEHFWPRWMENVLPKNEETSHAHEIYSSEAHQVMSLQSQSSRQGDVITKKIRVVCRKCNSGWMGNLEEKTKPLLLSLMSGEQIILNEPEQNLLSSWITMKVIISEHSEGETNITPMADRRSFFEDRNIPKYFGIYISRHNTKSVSGFLRHSATLSLTKDIQNLNIKGLQRNTQSISFICGQLFIHVIAARIDNIDINERFNLDPMTRLWPSLNESVDWSSVGVLSGTGLKSISGSMQKLTSSAKHVASSK